MRSPEAGAEDRARAIADAVNAERAASAKMAKAWSDRFDKLVDAGGNDVIDVQAARQLRRYFAAFETELLAEMHLPDPVPVDAAAAEAGEARADG